MKRYNKNFNIAKNKIFKYYDDLIEPKGYQFFSVEKKAWKRVIALLKNIPDEKKGYCDLTENKIYISDWALIRGGDILLEILLFELLCITFPKCTEKEILKMTRDRMHHMEKENSDVDVKAIERWRY